MRYLVALFLMLAAPAWADGWLSIEPVSQTVQVGQTFDVQLWVSQAGSDFNAVETAIPFDSSLVDYVYVNQLFHEGPYLREAMRGRLCGNNQVGGFTWWYMKVETTWVYTAESAMCSGFMATGPGMIAQHRFRAKAPGVMLLEYKNGLCCYGNAPPPAYQGYSRLLAGGPAVSPMHYASASVTIVGNEALDAGPASLAFRAKQVGSMVEFTVPAGSAGPVLVYDVAGRLVAKVVPPSRWAWARAGIYVAALGDARARFVVLP